MPAYYNDTDRFVCDWLQNLMDAGFITAGKIDDRSIIDLSSDDVRGYERVHFFAGIGGWDHALSLAGWPDDRPVWTGSCPCQPFSSAGRQLGHVDERHLWPAFFGLIAECRPAVVFGEQVANRLGREWLAGVRADLEALGYAVGAADLCAAGEGAPNIRQRLWWVADAGRERFQLRRAGSGEVPGAGPANARQEVQRQRCRDDAGNSGGLGDAPASGWPQGSGSHGSAERARDRSADDGGLGDAEHARLERHAGNGNDGDQPRRLAAQADGPVATAGGAGRLGDADSVQPEQPARDGTRPGEAQGGRPRGELAGPGEAGFWSRYDIVPCRDGKARRFEPGSFPLAHGVSARVGRLRAYGNAIVPQVAATFIKACLNY